MELTSIQGMQMRGIQGAGEKSAGDLRSLVARAGEDEKAVEELQAVFATLLVKEMRGALQSGFFGEQSQGDIYSGWLDEHVGKTLAQRNALGMREMIQEAVVRKAAVQAGGGA